MTQLTNLRGFKVETLQATDTKPNRIRIKDLRFDKSVILNYGAKDESLIQLITDFLKSKGIKIHSQCWAEYKGKIHLYSIYLTNDFSNQIK